MLVWYCTCVVLFFEGHLGTFEKLKCWSIFCCSSRIIRFIILLQKIWNLRLKWALYIKIKGSCTTDTWLMHQIQDGKEKLGWKDAWGVQWLIGGDLPLSLSTRLQHPSLPTRRLWLLPTGFHSTMLHCRRPKWKNRKASCVLSSLRIGSSLLRWWKEINTGRGGFKELAPSIFFVSVAVLVAEWHVSRALE